jgi:hypothetical protein
MGSCTFLVKLIENDAEYLKGVRLDNKGALWANLRKSIELTFCFCNF